MINYKYLSYIEKKFYCFMKVIKNREEEVTEIV